MLKHYLRSSTFKYYIPDWVFGIFLMLFFFYYTEFLVPFPRKFSLDNPQIQYPFATSERVSDNLLYILAGIIPGIVIMIVTFIQKNRKNLTQLETFHLLNVSLLGLLISFMFTAIFTDILKVWIARPRPDFLARCGPKSKTDSIDLVGFEVCTSPYGEMYLFDGMKSTPSGHSSMSFAGLLYLSYWLMGQFNLIGQGPRIFPLMFPFAPVLLAIYIALSRTQDYRHHFLDIILGSIIGILVANLTYYKFFPSLISSNCHIPTPTEGKD